MRWENGDNSRILVLDIDDKSVKMEAFDEGRQYESWMSELYISVRCDALTCQCLDTRVSITLM